MRPDVSDEHERTDLLGTNEYSINRQLAAAAAAAPSPSTVQETNGAHKKMLYMVRIAYTYIHTLIRMCASARACVRTE